LKLKRNLTEDSKDGETINFDSDKTVKKIRKTIKLKLCGIRKETRESAKKIFG
jgi:hypothetical protein